MPLSNSIVSSMSVAGHLQSFFKSHASLVRAPILLACSGGPDSVALAWSLHDGGFDKKMTFCLAHVNHHLRGAASNLDEKFVRALAKRLKWSFVSHSAPISLSDTGNLEERARVARYKGLEALARKVKSKLVLTAHTQEDQTETIFLNLLRGSGLDGLSGMLSLRPLLSKKVFLGRPLLGVSKEALHADLKRNKYAFRTDATNKKIIFNRNWLRHKIFPLIKQRFPQFQNRLSALGAIVQDEQFFWDQYISDLMEQLCKEKSSGCLLDFMGLMRYSPSIQRRILRRIVGEGILTFEGVEGWRRWMMAPPTSGRLWQLRKGWQVERLSKSKGAPSTQLFWVHHKPIKNIT